MSSLLTPVYNGVALPLAQIAAADNDSFFPGSTPITFFIAQLSPVGAPSS